MRQVASPLIVSISHQNEQDCKTPSNRVSKKRRTNSLKQSHAPRPRRHTLTYPIQVYRQSVRLDMTLSAQNVCATKRSSSRLRGDHRYCLPFLRTLPPIPRTPAWRRRPAYSRPVVDSDRPARDSNRNCASESAFARYPLPFTRLLRCLYGWVSAPDQTGGRINAATGGLPPFPDDLTETGGFVHARNALIIEPLAQDTSAVGRP